MKRRQGCYGFQLHDKTSDSVCSPETSAELKKQGLPVAENLRTQVLYKRKVR